MLPSNDNILSQDGRHIKIHTESGFEGMRRAGQLAARCLDFITPYVKPNVTTDQLNKLCHDFNESNGAKRDNFI